MKKSSISLLIVIGIILIIIIAIVSSYNGLVTKRENVDSKLSDLDVMFERRANLIPNLVSTVKGYTAHETEIINSITEARTKLSESKTVEDKANANQELSTALTSLMVVVENYPDLKSSQNFIQLADELAGAENRISTARRDYNDAVKTYNTAIKKMPTSIIASIFNFKDVEYFEATEESKKVPTVNFE